MTKYTYTDNIAVEILASAEKVAKFIMDLEKIKMWELSYNVPFTKHDWYPDSGKLHIGNQIKSRIPPWIFESECVDLKPYEVKWKFTIGPLEGAEYWRVEPNENECKVVKYLEYEIPNVIHKIIWRVLYRKLHHWGTLKQLKGIKRLAEQKGNE